MSKQCTRRFCVNPRLGLKHVCEECYAQRLFLEAYPRIMRGKTRQELLAMYGPPDRCVSDGHWIYYSPVVDPMTRATAEVDFIFKRNIVVLARVLEWLPTWIECQTCSSLIHKDQTQCEQCLVADDKLRKEHECDRRREEHLALFEQFGASERRRGR